MNITRFFKTPDAVTLASRDLEEAKRQLLVTQAQAEHSTKMVEYYQGVVNRLSKYVQSEMSQVTKNQPYPNISDKNIHLHA